MYRILIVDDEKIERKGIALLLKKLQIEMEIKEASNGQAAFEYLKNQEADILFTDIKMPFMDGIELIKKAVNLKRKMKIVIFSGYGEFEYAKAAIAMGVQNYILKPVDPKEFKNTVLQIIKELEEEKAIKQLQQKHKDFMREHILYSLVNGVSLEVLKEKVTKIIDFDFLNEYQRMYLVEFNADFFGKIGINFQNSLYKEYKNLFLYLNLNPQQCILFQKEKNLIRGGVKIENAVKIAQNVRNFIVENFKLHPYIAISEKIEKVEEFSEYFNQLELLMENKFYQTDVDIFAKDSIESGSILEQIDDDILMKQIKQDIKMKDIDSLKEHFQKLCSKYRRNRDFSQVYIKFIFSSLLKDFYENLPNKEEKELNQEVERLYQASDFNTIMEIINLNIKRLEETFGQNFSSVHREVGEVVQYIYKYYAQELSVDLLAEKVYMAPSYLSHIFKKETGQNLNKFIKSYRMEKAKEKLENTNEKIVNISYMVGYQNVSYFCQSFREYFGVSPQKFRNQGEVYEEDNEFFPK